MFALSRLVPSYAEKRTAWLPGSTCGQRLVRSPSFSLVSGVGTPPAEGTVERAALFSGENTILPSSPQLALRKDGASQRVTAAPPSTEIFLSLPSALKPIHWPSGEKNGEP